MSREVDFAAKPIDPDFMNKPDEYPETGTHFDHKVFAEGIARPDANGTPYPTKLGIHGLHVAVDFDGCVADGVCMDVCPVDVFEWDKYRCDKSDMIRESDCIDCMACETACPTKVIKINP